MYIVEKSDGSSFTSPMAQGSGRAPWASPRSAPGWSLAGTPADGQSSICEEYCITLLKGENKKCDYLTYNQTDCKICVLYVLLHEVHNH